ncbi:hypothetical protein CURTO8I2_280091 [Curtobacterium sp. 8I-2]|nr:hypothetical protein CURTO8I2_280091 [Curtobacterium sp. 8I-2]
MTSSPAATRPRPSRSSEAPCPTPPASRRSRGSSDEARTRHVRGRLGPAAQRVDGRLRRPRDLHLTDLRRYRDPAADADQPDEGVLVRPGAGRRLPVHRHRHHGQLHRREGHRGPARTGPGATRVVDAQALHREDLLREPGPGLHPVQGAVQGLGRDGVRQAGVPERDLLGQPEEPVAGRCPGRKPVEGRRRAERRRPTRVPATDLQPAQRIVVHGDRHRGAHARGGRAAHRDDDPVVGVQSTARARHHATRGCVEPVHPDTVRARGGDRRSHRSRPGRRRDHRRGVVLRPELPGGALHRHGVHRHGGRGHRGPRGDRDRGAPRSGIGIDRHPSVPEGLTQRSIRQRAARREGAPPASC